MKPLPEAEAALLAIERLAAARPDNVRELARIESLPIYSFSFGTQAATAPVLFITGGVHGLERIGTEVATAWLTQLCVRLDWDAVLHDALARCRVVVLPVINPVGMARGQRANGNGVDLMRNAPEHPHGGTPLLGGHRISPLLPWYMGKRGAEMEPEASALVRRVEEDVFRSPFSIALDLHSGYGFVDRLWYPYARTREVLPDQPAIAALGRLLDETLPNHVYKFEQTAQSYTIRGDLWDYLYDQRRAHGGGTLLPLTLEMGSWAWVRKNPAQLFSALGRFNPVKPHRLRRTLRRHLPMIDFLLHATASHASWMPR
ncbi:MAG TPA: DUF2817 domain-containing protein [Kofleriaceae bacterium]